LKTKYLVICMPTCIYQAKKDSSLLLCVSGIKDLYVPDTTNSGQIMGCMYEKG